MNQIRPFLDTLFNQLDQADISYCILHGYETLPDYAPSDIDIAVDPKQKDRLDALLSQIAFETGFTIIQNLYYDIPHCFYYVFTGTTSKDIVVIKLDFLIDDQGINRYYLPSRIFLKSRIKHKSFYVPSHGMQAVYLLIKKAIKEKFAEEHFKKLKDLLIDDPEGIAAALAHHFDGELRGGIIRALSNGDMGQLLSLVPALQETLEKKFKPSLIIEAAWSMKRIFWRVLHPTGLFVIVLSPDGGGKSSVARATLEKLIGCFRKNKYIHWRPGLLPQLRTLLGKSKLENEIPVTNPHSPNKRGRASSLLRWLYYSVDYVIGYYLKLLPMKIRTTAVMMDRYYYDVIVDPMRYGFNLPTWLLRLPLKIIPKPDLTIYLDNEPEELYMRKQELPVAELERQVRKWREFIPSLPNARIVTTDKPLEDVVHEVTKAVLGRRAEMTKIMLKIDPDESRYLWKSDITDYIALPSKKKCRWIIPSNPKLAEKAWELYRPHSIRGKIYKRLMKLLSSSAVMNFMKSNKLSSHK